MKEERQMKVLLDVDTGVDDSIALLYALFNEMISANRLNFPLRIGIMRKRKSWRRIFYQNIFIG